MKESGKLLELLNEYSKNIGHFNEEDLQGQTKAWILSKEFGWVKWLVENGKIDFRKLNYKNIYMSDYGSSDDIFLAYNKGEQGIIYTVDYYETLLMLLAIQDEPIRFLCEIIK